MPRPLCNRILNASRKAHLALWGLVLASAMPAGAATVGHWRFEGTPGTTVGVVPNSDNPGTHDGNGSAGAVYDASVPGPTLFDPVSSTSLANGSSLDISGGAQVTIPDDNALDAPQFTIEAFINTPNQNGYPSYVSHRSGNGWQLDIEPADEVRTRFDTSLQSNQVVGSGPEQWVADGNWHHTAVTFDGQVIRHFTDHANVATQAIEGVPTDATTVAADLIFGGHGDWPTGTRIDEVRYSDSVLQPYEFLQVPGVTGFQEAFWRLEGTPGDAIGTATNTMNPGSADGVGQLGVVYADDVPGPLTLDPTTGTTYENQSSLDMASGRVEINNLNLQLDAPEFTIQAFVKVADQNGYPNFVGRLDGDRGWQLDIDNAEDARARIDTAARNNQVVGSGAAQSLADNQWHHVALTFDGSLMQFYVDYGNLATKTLIGDPAHVNQITNSLFLSESGFPAGSYLDEVRYTNVVLAPEQFLRAVPEPSTLALAAFSLCCLLARPRRRR